ncbi:MAG: MBOAT family protein [Clostridia bacterium]|nr:MBOAT family protein [Clostridia bacterium]
MQFCSLQFLIFLFLFLLIYFLVPKKIRKYWLLIANFLFYLSWDYKYVIILMLIIVVSYLTGFFISKAQKKKPILIAGITSCLLILISFKYSRMLYEGFHEIMHINIDVMKDFILPIGISFYTFMAISYMIDVYRDRDVCEKNICIYMLYLSFFPYILCGPIERSKHMFTQFRNLDKEKVFNYERITSAGLLFVWGCFQKLVISERLSLLVDEVFQNYHKYGATAVITAVIMYSIQIYCDFSSYSNIAIAISKLIGIDIMNNFSTPYFSRNIAVFWRRWHISLSSWIRDYLYIPLGGNRCGKFRKYMNTLLVFMISGLWHGANITYIVWGFLHGIYQIISNVVRPVKQKIEKTCKFRIDTFGYHLFEIIITYLFVCIAWLFFRANSITQAVDMLVRIVTRWDPWSLFDQSIYTWGLDRNEFGIAVIAILVLLIVDLIKYKHQNEIISLIKKQPILFRWLIYIALIAAVIVLGEYGPDFNAHNFIYTAY